MIDWPNLGANALWILGCALALATLSHASWRAHLLGQRLRQQLQTAGAQYALAIAGTLFCLGLAATSATPLETALWLALALAFLAQIWLLRRQRRAS